MTHRPWSTGALPALLVLAILAAAPAAAQAPAPAAAPQDAAALMKEGEAHVVARRYEAAIESFEKAWAISPDPACQYNIAVIYLARILNPMEAWEHATLFAEAAKTDADRKDAADLLVKIEAELSKTRGKLVVSVTPKAEETWVDRQAAGVRMKGPATWVLPGDHVVTAWAPGHEPARAQVTVKAGETTAVNMFLKEQAPGIVKVESPDPAAKAFVDGEAIGLVPAQKVVAAGAHVIRVEVAGLPPSERKVTIAPSETVTVRLDVRASLPRKGLTKRQWGYVTIGIAGALVAGGSISYGLAVKDANSTSSLRGSAYDTRVKRAKSEAYAGYALWGLGAAAVGAGLYLVLAPGAAGHAALVPSGPSGPGLTASVAW